MITPHVFIRARDRFSEDSCAVCPLLKANKVHEVPEVPEVEDFYNRESEASE